MRSFVPEYRFRPQQNFFFDFFPSRSEFTKFMWDNILTDKQSQEITDAFLSVVYYSFERVYRNKIVYEQEYFYQDFAREMFDKRLHLQLLFKLWMIKNDDDPFDMINDNWSEWFNHTRTDDNQEHQSDATDESRKLKEKERANTDLDSNTQTKGESQTSDNNQEQEKTKTDTDAKTDANETRESNTKNTENETANTTSDSNSKSTTTTNTETNENTNTTNLSRENEGSLQGELALSEMIDGNSVENTSEVATSASAQRNKMESDSNLDTETIATNEAQSTGKNDRERQSNGELVDKRGSEATSNTQTQNERARQSQNENRNVVDNRTDTRSQAQNERLNNAEQSNQRTEERNKTTHNETHSFDERKRNKLNKASVINSFSDMDLQIGIEKFARTFRKLFSRMSADDFEWRGYRETDFGMLGFPPIVQDPQPLSTIITQTNVGYIPDEKVNSYTITKNVLRDNSNATADDFFIANILWKDGIAFLIGDNAYDGSVAVNYRIAPYNKKIDKEK